MFSFSNLVKRKHTFFPSFLHSSHESHRFVGLFFTVMVMGVIKVMVVVDTVDLLWTCGEGPGGRDIRMIVLKLKMEH